MPSLTHTSVVDTQRQFKYNNIVNNDQTSNYRLDEESYRIEERIEYDKSVH